MRIRDLLVFITLYSMIFGTPHMLEYLYHWGVTLKELVLFRETAVLWRQCGWRCGERPGRSRSVH
jgi:hypothetical protein